MPSQAVDPIVFRNVVKSFTDGGLPLDEAVRRAEQVTSWGGTPPVAQAGNSSPADIDPVVSASAPLDVERDLGAERRSRYVNAGLDPDMAERVVASQDRIHGPMSPDLFDYYNTPEGNAALAARFQRSKNADANMNAMADSMYPHQQFPVQEVGPSRYDPIDRSRPPVPGAGTFSTPSVPRLPDDLPEGYFSKQAQEDIKKYGDGLPADQRSEDQIAAQEARSAREGRESGQWARQLAAARDAAKRNGTTVEEELAEVGAEPPAGFRKTNLKGMDKAIARENDRRAAWQAQAMLAGSNPAKNAVNAMLRLPEAQQNEVIKARLMPQDKGNETADNTKMSMLMAELKQRSDEAAATRQDNFEQWKREQEAAREQWERTRQVADEAELRRRAESEREFDLKMQQVRDASQTARTDSETKLAGVQAQLAEIQAAAEFRRQELEAKTKKENDALSRADRDRKENAAVAIAGPGAIDILAGNYGTPRAQEALAKIARDADKSWTGFYNSDAERMDAVLHSLGVPLRDRMSLVQKHGLGVMAATGAGGRTGPISGNVNAFYGPPSYMPDAIQQ